MRDYSIEILRIRSERIVMKISTVFPRVFLVYCREISIFIGFMVKTGVENGHVRSFAAESDVLHDTVQRSNIRHDTLLALKESRDSKRIQLPQKDRKKQEKLDTKKNHGILGPRVLRACSKFDVGSSFMSDSLHNVYIGAFVSVLFHILFKYDLSTINKCSSFAYSCYRIKKKRLNTTSAQLKYLSAEWLFTILHIF